MSCLFDSISHFLQIPGHSVRKTICDYMEKSLPIIDGLDTKTLLEIESPNYNNYIEVMRHNHTQGGAIEIQAACNIWNLKVKVLNIRDNTKDIKFKPLIILNYQDRPKKIKISWNGGHYEPVS